MAKITATPSSYHVFNEFDQHGLILGLPRLEDERNAAYRLRLMDIFVHRANATYHGLIYGITRELGLELTEVLKIVPDSGLTMPAVMFEETKCTLYSNYPATIVATLDRFTRAGGAYTLQQLTDRINATGVFTATLLTDADPTDRSMTIFNQGSIVQVEYEDISGKGVRVQLENVNLVPNTVSVESTNLTERVSSDTLLRHSGQYYVDLSSGTVFCASVPSPGSSIRYKYRDDNFIVEASPVILHNLQSDDFKTKMFHQSATGYNGLPNELGADILNELLSVFPMTWGK